MSSYDNIIRANVIIRYYHTSKSHHTGYNTSIIDSVRDEFRESIIRLGVKGDNGLEKPNQGLKKAEKVKDSDQISRARYTLTTARGVR